MSAYDQLEQIKGTLLKIRDSEALQNVKTDSDVAKGLKGVFGGVSDVLAENSRGIASSRGAQNAVTAGESVVDTKGGGNSVFELMNNLRQENSKLQKAFEAEKSTREGLEADRSIGDQQTNEQLEQVIASIQSGGTGTGATNTSGDGTPTTGGTTASGAPAGGSETDASLTQGDPVAEALSQDFLNQQAVVQEQLAALNNFVAAEDADTQTSLNNIQATADLQAKRVAKENERLAQASQVAGIVSGRGMYSPYEHEGIVSEVIQDGLDRITQIELTAQDAKLEAKKAHREFRYEAFVESTEMVSALSELKRQTVVDIGKRLQEVEEAQREKMRFDQEQQDRTSFILAPELVGATPEEIQAAALANGINPGALMRTVAEYQSEQEDAALDRKLTEEQILTQQSNRSIAQQRFNLEKIIADRKASGEDGGEEVKKMTDKEIESFAASNGWTPPYGITLEEAQRIESAFAGEPGAVKLARAREILYGFNSEAVDAAVDDVSALAESDDKVQDTLDGLTKDLGLAGFFGIGGKDILESGTFKGYIAEAQAEAVESGTRLTTAEIVDAAAAMALQDAENNAKVRAEWVADMEAKDAASPFRTANSTEAVRYSKI